MDLGLSGLASGFDWRSFIDQMLQVERVPQTRMRAEQNKLSSVRTAYGNLKSQLGSLQTKLNALKDENLYQSRSTRVSDATLASATAATGAATGEYRFTVTQWATAANWQGAANVGAALHHSSDVSSLVIGEASFARAITAGTFTVNGRQVSIATTDTLQEVFDKISAATSGAVTGSYDPGTDTITLASSSPIVLGAATDTSNFLQAAKLSNNGTNTVTSRSALGTARLSAALAQSNLSTAITGDANGNGEFRINGVSITYNTATDTLASILARINQSAAGVYASYDAENDRFLLTNKTTGDVGIGLEDVTGNFLGATGLAGGTLQRGADLLYSVNGSGTLVSRSNTITDASSGITGLSVTVLKSPNEGSPLEFTVMVEADTAKVATAVNDFVTEYNKTQSLIDSQTAITTDANGKVNASVLAGYSDIYDIATRLRSLATASLENFSGSLLRLNDLGINSSGKDNSLTLETTKLNDLLASNLDQIAAFFTDATSGFVKRFDDYLERTLGEQGALAQAQTTLNKQIESLGQQIDDQERYVQNVREQMIKSFVAMENAQAQIKQQLQFLTQRFNLAG